MANEKTVCVPVAGMASNQILTIGRQMENNYRKFVFDCSGFGVEVAAVQLVHQRPGDAAPYIAAASDTDTLTWIVANTDTAYAGYGTGELRVTFADGLAKSVTFTTLTVRSITADTVIPSQLQSWYDAMIDYIDEHAASPEAIEAAVEAYLIQHPIQFPVTSVNGATGAVMLTASDVGALPNTTQIPARTSDLVNDSGFLTSVPAEYVTDTELATTLNGYATTSALTTGLAGKQDTLTAGANITITGNVISATGGGTPITVDSALSPTSQNPVENQAIYSAFDSMKTYIDDEDTDVYNTVTAMIPTVPTNVSAFTNDAGYLTTAVTSFNNQSGAVTYSAPVTSVNGMTGAVTVPDTNTTYTISISGNVISLTPSSGSAQTITLPVWNGGVS